MRSFAYRVNAFALIVLAFVFLSSKAEAACGVFEVSKGDVKVQSKQTKKISAASAGSKICSGDTVTTGRDSRAKLKMEDGNELNISPDSTIMLENYQFNPAQNKKKVLLNVLQGKVRAATKQENMYNDKAADGDANSFQVKTKSAVAGVRGTDFLTGFDARTSKTEVVTFKGQVEIGQIGANGAIMNPMQVGAGQRIELVPGQAPALPQSMPSGELQQMNSDSQADATPSASMPAPAPGGAASGNETAEASSPSSPPGQGSASADNATPSQDRAPANTPPQPSSGSMTNVGDLGGEAAFPGGTRGPANVIGGPPIIVPPPIVVPPSVPHCQQCIDAVQNAPTKVNVRIRLPGQ